MTCFYCQTIYGSGYKRCPKCHPVPLLKNKIKILERIINRFSKSLGKDNEIVECTCFNPCPAHPYEELVDRPSRPELDAKIAELEMEIRYLKQEWDDENKQRGWTADIVVEEKIKVAELEDSNTALMSYIQTSACRYEKVEKQRDGAWATIKELEQKLALVPLKNREIELLIEETVQQKAAIAAKDEVIKEMLTMPLALSKIIKLKEALAAGKDDQPPTPGEVPEEIIEIDKNGIVRPLAAEEDNDV